MKRAYIGSMTSEVAGLLTKNVDAIVGPVEGGYILEAKGQAKPLLTFRRYDRLHDASHLRA